MSMGIQRAIHMNNPFTFRKAIIVNKVEETPNTHTYTLKCDGGLKALPGQFNMLYVYGLGEAPISLSNIPIFRGGHTLLEHTVRVMGAVTRAIISRLEIGSLIGIRGAYGNGWPLRDAEGKDVAIVGGGIGIAPLRPIIKYIEHCREKFGRINILFGAKSPRDMPYKYELNNYNTISNTKLLLSSDTPAEEWTHYTGFVTDLIEYIDVNVKNSVAFVCGPEAMMRVAVKKLLNKGFKKEYVYISLERRMRCGIGVCGTCQFGHYFVCRDGPVFRYSDVEDYLWVEGI
jgi:2-polyprenylphenol hydroxylase and related flavodoxin oxidoreductases